MDGKSTCNILLHKHIEYFEIYKLYNNINIPIVLIAPENIIKLIIVNLNLFVI